LDNLPEGRSSAFLTAISVLFLLKLMSLSKVNITAGPNRNVWKIGSCTNIPVRDKNKREVRNSTEVVGG